DGPNQLGALALARVALADDVVLERQNAVVVGAAAPQHRAGRHDAALGGLDDRQVTGAARLAGDPIVARIDEADEFRRFLVEQGVAALRVGARRVVPGLRIARLDVRLVERRAIAGVVAARALGPRDLGVAAVAVGAAEDHGRVDVHGRLVGPLVA